MKNILQLSAFVLFMMIAVWSCKKDDTIIPVDNTIQQGNWKVTFFEDSGTDETDHFSGYQFIFNADGSISATNGPSTVNGTWTSGTDDSQSKLILNFGSTTPFDDLNEDWHVTEETSTLIKCEHISGGNGGTDFLTFEKI
ncbi:MAG: hypothetical protein ABIO98_07910 [Chitinophagales bacterium]